MISTTAESHCLKQVIPATLDAVDQFCAEFRTVAEVLEEPWQRFAAELLLREALTNAVFHGCRSDPSRRIVCAVRLRARRLTIAVQDDGDGFDWRSALQRQTADTRCSGRGFEILRHYATRFRFNHSGNATVILRRF